MRCGCGVCKGGGKNTTRAELSDKLVDCGGLLLRLYGFVRARCGDFLTPLFTACPCSYVLLH